MPCFAPGMFEAKYAVSKGCDWRSWALCICKDIFRFIPFALVDQLICWVFKGLGCGHFAPTCSALSCWSCMILLGCRPIVKKCLPWKKSSNLFLSMKFLFWREKKSTKFFSWTKNLLFNQALILKQSLLFKQDLLRLNQAFLLNPALLFNQTLLVVSSSPEPKSMLLSKLF